MSDFVNRTGSDYLDQLLADGRITAPTASVADLPEPEPTDSWDGHDSAEVIAELRDDSRDLAG
ncbi:MAG: hypothetical protein ACRDT4_16690 [Micromonosporaceae bacterium]